MNKQNTIAEYCSIKDLSNILRIDYQTIYEKVNMGEIKSYKIGKLIRIRKTDFDSWLESKEVLHD